MTLTYNFSNKYLKEDAPRLIDSATADTHRNDEFGVNQPEPDAALMASRPHPNNKRCAHCGLSGHLMRDCFKKHPKLRNIKGRKGRRKKNRHPGLQSSNAARAHGRKFKANKAENSIYPCHPVAFRSSFTPRKRESKSQHLNTWLIDSGATCHMVNKRALFLSFHALEVDQAGNQVSLGDNSKVSIYGKGEVLLNLNGHRLVLTDVLFVPKLACNLISPQLLNGFQTVFGNNSCAIYKDGQLIEKPRKRSSSLYYLSRLEALRPNSANTATLEVSHQRHGHPGATMSKRLGIAPFLDCITCKKGNIKVKKFGNRKSQLGGKSFFDIISSDTCGPIKPSSLKGKKYFTSFILDNCRYSFIKFHREKSEMPRLVEEIAVEVKSLNSEGFRILFTDNALEYKSDKLKNIAIKHGFVQRFTVPHSPQLNGIAERYNQTVVSMARALLIQAGAPQYLWIEAVNTANYIRNRNPTSALDCSPYQTLFGKKPDLEKMVVWGCDAVVKKIHTDLKFEPRGSIQIFIGYNKEDTGYRLMHPQTRRVTVRRNVFFIENSFQGMEELSKLTDPSEDSFDSIPTKIPSVYSEMDSNNPTNMDIDCGYQSAPVATETNDTEDVDVPEKTTQEIRSKRSCALPRDCGLYDEDDFYAFMAEVIPSTFLQSKHSKHSQEWKKAIDSELRSLNDNNTYDLQVLPEGRKPISSRWIFNIKRDGTGNIDRYKARLVAKGFNQIYGVDYKETFAPVVSFNTVRFILSLAVRYDWPLYQMDVVTAFLNGDLEEDIYMSPPEGTNTPIGYVWKLKKAIYGLKQASRMWHKKIADFLKDLDFKSTYSEPCLFHKDGVIILIYVDDLVLTGYNIKGIDTLKEKLLKEFKMKDLGELSFFVGVMVERTESKIKISQRRYALDVLSRFSMENCKPAKVPLDPGMKKEFYKDNYELLSLIELKKYQKIIGSLIYLSVMTRPDLTFSTSLLGRFLQAPRTIHMKGAKQVLRYLRGSIDKFIAYDKESSNLFPLTYVDADLGGCIKTKKSTSGYIVYNSNGPILWKTERQSVTAGSTMEAEYIAAFEACNIIRWLKNLMEELDIPTKKFKILEDNQPCIKYSNTPKFSKNSKHIALKYHLVRELVNNNTVELIYVSTDEQLADAFTKILGPQKFKITFNKETTNLPHPVEEEDIMNVFLS